MEFLVGMGILLFVGVILSFFVYLYLIITMDTGANWLSLLTYLLALAAIGLLVFGVSYLAIELGSYVLDS